MSTSARFTDNLGVFDQGRDRTDRIRTNIFLQPAYAATIAVAATESFILVKPAILTGAVTFTIGVGTATTVPYVGDEVEFYLESDGTTRTATFGTGFQATLATFAVTTAKYGYIAFKFNGTTWVETSRSISA